MTRVVIILLMLILGGCAEKPVLIPESYDYRDQLMPLKSLENWEVNGRMSIQTSEEAFSASFQWRKLINYQRIEITGMLGQTYAILEITPQRTLLTVSDEEPITARDLDSLMWTQLGFTIPVELLNDWIKAYPTQSTEKSIILDDDGFIIGMSYLDWRVNYKRYKKFQDVSSIYLPSRVTVTNSRETIKLAVKEWLPL